MEVEVEAVAVVINMLRPLCDFFIATSLASPRLAT
jgi:hypothetical protein